MGRIVVSTATSVDGFAEGPGGDLSVVPLDAGFDEHSAEQVARAAGLLHGATTYRRTGTYAAAARLREAAGDTPIFAGVGATDLALLDVRRVEGTESVLLRHAVGG